MPRIGIGIGVGRWNYAGGFADSYSARVLADGGAIESLTCVANASTLLQSASLLLIPSGYKSGVAYAALPNTSNGDLTWTRASTANRTNSSGNIESVGSNVPRLSYMYGSCPALLLEPQRTNSIRNSTMQGAATGTPGTLPTNWVIALANLSQSIVDIGNENGLTYIDIRLNGTANATTAAIYFDTTTAANAQTWVNSLYFKTINTTNPPSLYRLIQIERTSTNGYITESNSTITASSSLTRYNQVVTLSGGATVARLQSGIVFSLTSGQSYDFTIRIAAPQLEQGAFPTTYIPTTSATATRLADSFTRNNIYTNGFISASGGTWYVELRNNVAYTRDTGINGLFLSESSTGSQNSLSFRNTGGANSRLVIQKFIGTNNSDLYTLTTSTAKIAMKWDGSTVDVFVNGTKVVSASAFTYTQLQFLAHAINVDVPKFIQAMALFNAPLSDSQCQSLTT